MTTTWDGTVTDIWENGDTFTAKLHREDAPDLFAEFSMRECGISVEPGDLLIITADAVKKRDLGVWTQEEINDIRRRAKARYEQLGFDDQ